MVQPEETKPKFFSFHWVKNYLKKLRCLQAHYYPLVKHEKSEEKRYGCPKIADWFKNMYKFPKEKTQGQKSLSSLETYETLPQYDEEEDDFDWWTKFYASLDKCHVSTK